MTYLMKRCVTSLETLRDAREVVETCTNWGAETGGDEAGTEPSSDFELPSTTTD